MVSTIEAIADDSWVDWAGCLVPNIVEHVKKEAKAQAWEEVE